MSQVQVARLPVWLSPDSPPDAFPRVESALEEPNGLLAVGGDLSPQRLLAAYRRGIFPWYSDDQPILWWSPEPRAVLFPAGIHVSRSLRKTLRQGRFSITVNDAFAAVVEECAAPRLAQPGTWITPAMRAAYLRLHDLGWACSVECRRGTALVGGLYGVAIGAAFFGESMFSRERDASKVALVHLSQMGFELIDCQMPTQHLSRLGAVNISRREFLERLKRAVDRASPMQPSTSAGARR